MTKLTVEVNKAILCYVVWTNTDLTEGRGVNIPMGVCKLKSTAQRIGKSRYVQGSDCPVTEEKILQIRNQWYGPIDLKYPTKEDEKKQLAIAAKESVVEKAKAAGLTNDEIATLSRGL